MPKPSPLQPWWGGSGHDQTGGLCCEGATCQERHVKSASAGMQKSELCKPQTHPPVWVPWRLSGPAPWSARCARRSLPPLRSHPPVLLQDAQSNLPLTLRGLLAAPNGSPVKGVDFWTWIKDLKTKRNFSQAPVGAIRWPGLFISPWRVKRPPKSHLSGLKAYLTSPPPSPRHPRCLLSCVLYSSLHFQVPNSWSYEFNLSDVFHKTGLFKPSAEWLGSLSAHPW